MSDADPVRSRVESAMADALGLEQAALVGQGEDD